MIVYSDKRRIPFKIDRADWPTVRRYKWRVAVYPKTWIGKGTTLRVITLHLFLLGNAPPGLEWDHRNRDPLDNRRRNLRAVTHAQNNANMGRHPNNTSGAPGVSWSKSNGKWVAQAKRNGRKLHLGYFSSIPAAARAYRRFVAKRYPEEPNG